VLGLVNEHVHLEKTGDKTAKVYIWHEAKTAMTKMDKLMPFEKYIWQHPEHLYGFYESIQPDAKHHKRSYFNKGIIAVVVTLLFAAIPAWYIIKQGSSSGIEASSSNAAPEKKAEPTAEQVQAQPTEMQNKINLCMVQYKWSYEQCREAVDPEYLKANNDAMLAKTNNSMEAISIKYNPAKPYDTEYSADYSATAKPVFSGCVKYGNRYVAYTQQGTRLDVDASVCQRLINEGDRPFNYFANPTNGLNSMSGATGLQDNSANLTTNRAIQLTPAESKAYLEYMQDRNQANNIVVESQTLRQTHGISSANAL